MLDLLIITLVVVILALWLQSKPFFWKGKDIVWKLPLPIVGNTGLLLFKSWHTFWREFYSSNSGKIIGFHFFGNPAILIKDPELLKKVMISDAQHFSEREFNQDKIDPIGRSLFFSKGQEWKNQRTKMTPYFTPARIKAMMPYLHPLTDTFVDAIAKQSNEGPIDTRTVSLKLATDVIMSNVFGLKPDAFENPNSYFYNLQKELVGFDTGIRAVVGILSPSIYEFLGLTFFRSSTIKKLSNFVVDVIAQRSNGIGVRPDFMQGMIELLDVTEKDSSTQNGAPKQDKVQSKTKFDQKTVIGQCMLMYSAGTETTGYTLSYVLYELALNQMIQDRLREEINAMLDETDGEYGVEELQGMVYMNQVLSESLRKYPVASVIGRKCSKKYNLDGLELPVGTVIAIPIVSYHRDPNVFPDPEKFDPDRFSPSSTLVSGTYLPFGLGPRTCIGMKLALAELSLSLVKLLPKFKLVRCPETPPTVIFGTSLTFSPGKPLWVKAEPIS